MEGMMKKIDIVVARGSDNDDFIPLLHPSAWQWLVHIWKRTQQRSIIKPTNLHVCVSSLTVTLVPFCKDFPSAQLSSSLIPMQDRITLVGSISWILNSFSTVPLEESLDWALSDPFDDAPSAVLNIPPVSAITSNLLKCCVDGIRKRKECLTFLACLLLFILMWLIMSCHVVMLPTLSTKTPNETRSVIAFICLIYMLHLSKGISD